MISGLGGCRIASWPGVFIARGAVPWSWPGAISRGRSSIGSGAERMDIAGGHAASAVWGRYVVFSLAANADGRTPENEEPELAEISDHFVDVALSPLGERAAMRALQPPCPGVPRPWHPRAPRSTLGPLQDPEPAGRRGPCGQLLIRRVAHLLQREAVRRHHVHRRIAYPGAEHLSRPLRGTTAVPHREQRPH